MPRPLRSSDRAARQAPEPCSARSACCPTRSRTGRRALRRARDSSTLRSRTSRVPGFPYTCSAPSSKRLIRSCPWVASMRSRSACSATGTTCSSASTRTLRRFRRRAESRPCSTPSYARSPALLDAARAGRPAPARLAYARLAPRGHQLLAKLLRRRHHVPERGLDLFVTAGFQAAVGIDPELLGLEHLGGEPEKVRHLLG